MPRKLLALVVALLCLAAPARAALEEAPPIKLDCAGVLLMEPESGQVIFEVDADAPRPIASVTKIMAILLACEAVEDGRAQLDDVVNISARAASMGGSQVLLDTGEQQPLSVLIKSMIVASANDATVAVGEFLFGSEQSMVARMNERARELGLQNTRFANATGLPVQDHYASARDVALMSRELIKHPIYFEYATIWMDTLTHGDGRVTELTNTNRLTRLYDGCDGLKTGSTNEAGYCMAATAKRAGMRLIAVVLGAKTSKARFETATAMLDYGFANYRTYEVAQKGAKVRGVMPVTGGSLDSVGLTLGEDMTLLIAKGAEQDIELTSNLPGHIPAPVAPGQQVGTVDVALAGRLVGQIPIVASAEVPERSYASALRQAIGHWYYD
ncbi:MAG: D-alanyl-D-alanine carboxypeptidase family protein [Clostridia bacterium]